MTDHFSPEQVVYAFWNALYDWEVRAAADLEFLMLGAECPEEMDMSILESKIESMNHEDHIELYSHLVTEYCTERHHSANIASYGSPPTYDPAKEKVIGRAIVLDDEAYVNTEVKDDFDGWRQERAYHLFRSVSPNGIEWKIDSVVEKAHGQLQDLL